MAISQTAGEAAHPGEPVDDPAIWTGADFDARTDTMFRLTPDEARDLIAMARQVAAGLGGDPNGLLERSPEDFDLGCYAPTLERIRASLRQGAGVALIRGLPMDALDPLETAALYWGIGRHLGEPRSNNPEGDMLGHVMDTGKDYHDPKHRGYQTSATMDYHCDQCDIVGLLVIQTSKSGGESKIASSMAVYNEMLRRHPDLVPVLMEPFHWTKHGEFDEGEAPTYQSPVFNFLDGRLSVAFGPKHMEKGHQVDGVPPMTAEQKRAIAAMEQVCEDLHYDMEFERGDLQFLNGAVTLHTRTAFEDWPEPERRRRLWRLWLRAPDMRPANPYIWQWRDGVRTRDTVERVVLA